MRPILLTFAVLWAGTAVLFAVWIAAVLLLDSVPCLRRWTEPPWDPEMVALDALEDLWTAPAYEWDGAA